MNFYSEVPRFTLEKGDAPPKLYTALLRQVDGIDGYDIKSCQTVPELAAPRMAVCQDVEELLRRLVQRLFPTNSRLVDHENKSAKPPYVVPVRELSSMYRRKYGKASRIPARNLSVFDCFYVELAERVLMMDSGSYFNTTGLVPFPSSSLNSMMTNKEY